MAAKQTARHAVVEITHLHRSRKKRMVITDEWINSVANGITSRVRSEGPVVLTDSIIQNSLRTREKASGRSVAHAIVELGDKTTIFWMMKDRELLSIRNRDYKTVGDAIGPEGTRALSNLRKEGKTSWLKSFKRV
jgi:hypothetical protein